MIISDIHIIALAYSTSKYELTEDWDKYISFPGTSNIFDITCFIYAYQNLSHKIGQVYRPKLREDYLLCVDVINERV